MSEQQLPAWRWRQLSTGGCDVFLGSEADPLHTIPQAGWHVLGAEEAQSLCGVLNAAERLFQDLWPGMFDKAGDEIDSEIWSRA